MTERVVVVGGGVIGLCSAYLLGRAGFDVTVVDQAETGQAASKGNAGWITPALAAPLPGPGVLGYGIRSLVRRDSPLYIRPASVPGLAPWLLRFASYCTRGAHARGLETMARLNARALPAYERLREDGVDIDIRGGGLLFCFLDAGHVETAVDEVRAMAAAGYETPTVLEGDALRLVEPALSRRVAAGFMVPQERYVDPSRLTGSLRSTAEGIGVHVRENEAVLDFERRGASVTGVRTTNGVHSADHVVVAAGAWSGRLLRRLGTRLPLQAGKGYSFGVRPARMPRGPLYLHDARVGLTPFGDRVRLAGTMEFSGVNTKLSLRRIDAIERSASVFLEGGLTSGRTEDWTGMRPLFPDGLPAIGRLRRFPNVTVATGHSMLGITLGAATGELVTQLVATGEALPGLEAFSPRRFGA